jgi:hypothetical protein
MFAETLETPHIWRGSYPNAEAVTEYDIKQISYVSGVTELY